MSLRNGILIAFALVAAIGTALVARGWINSERAAMVVKPRDAGSAEPSQFVLVAKINLPAGRFVKAEDFRWRGWPEGEVPASYIVQGKRAPEDIAGAVVRSGIMAEEPIIDSRLVMPGERGFMAAVLQPGWRAVSVSVTATTGISGFVFPGDHVDILVTHAVAVGSAEASDRKSALVTETILRDVRVVAIDQTTDDQNATPVVARTVTFEVTPKQAEIVSVAHRLGELTLSLRSLSREESQGDLAQIELDEGDAALPAEVLSAAGLQFEPTAMTVAEGRFTTDNEVSRLLGGLGAARKVTVMRGAKSNVQGFRNGTAVSDQSAAGTAPPPDGATQ